MFLDDKRGDNPNNPGKSIKGDRHDEMGGCRLHLDPIRPIDNGDPGRCRGIDANELVYLHITPDRKLDNHSIGDLVRSISGMYQAPLARWNGRGFNKPERASWEVVMGKGEAEFYLAIPATWRPVIEKQISVVWPRATIKQVEDPLTKIKPAALAKLELKNHFMFSIKADKRTLGVLPSLLETTKMLSENEKVAVQVILDPAPGDWWQSAAVGYEEFRSGKMPKRLEVTPKAAGLFAVKAAAWMTLGTIRVITELLTGEEPEKISLEGTDKATALRERPVGHTVADKLKGDALDVTIRVAVEADAAAAKSILRSIWYAFRSLDGDNSFAVTSQGLKSWQKVLDREPGLKINHDYLSPKEVGMLTQLPTGPLQEEYKLTAVDYRETNLPKIVTEGGLEVGEVTYHGQTQKVYLPTKSHDELCLPHVTIGGMGTGKTKGFGSNLAIEAVRNGMSAVVIDPAKGEIGDEVELALSPDQIVRVRFGMVPIALDWREATHSERARNRLANEIIAFAEAATDDAGAQTVRYLRAAAKAVPTGRLSEVVQLMTDTDYRAEAIAKMREQDRDTWIGFNKLSEARQAQIAAPILNRLDVVRGDDYLEQCLDAKQGLDFVELLDGKPRVIILDIPKSELGTEGVDVLASLIATKLDLAMVLRKTKHPVFVIQDEPHQYQRSAKIWRSAAVESRKWRFSYVWMFHAWEQIPRDVAAIIQAAGPHYHLYTSSKATYKALAEEIKPFEVEEAMRTPRWWAINIIKAGGVVVEPFLAKMTPPPSEVKKHKNKEKL